MGGLSYPKKDKGYSKDEETIKAKGHLGYLLTENFTPEEDDDDSLVASADSQNDDADDADDDGADNVYHAGDIRPEFENKYLPINEPTHEKPSP